METLLKNYITLSSEWVPKNPVESFLPFLTSLIHQEEIDSCTIEELSNCFEKKYEIKLTFFILKALLNVLKANGHAKKHLGKWLFQRDKIKSYRLISESIQSDFNKKFDELIDNFVKYCSDSTIERSDVVEALNEFVSHYDTEILFQNSSMKHTDNGNVLSLFLIDYVKELPNISKSLYTTLLQICEGSIIKSFLFSNIDSAGIFKGQMIFLDTPVILRLLGYYGKYLKDEYEYLLNELRVQGASVYLFKHNYDEIMYILRAAEIWVERLDFDFSKASEVSIYYRVNELKCADVASDIELLQTNLKRLSIELFEIAYGEYSESYVEPENEIEEIILKEYSENNANDQTVYQQLTIENDVKSTKYIYLIRSNNAVLSYRDANALFVTSNSGFVNAIKTYNRAKFTKDDVLRSFSPVVKDSFVGLVVLSCNGAHITNYAEKKVMSYCYSAYKPSRSKLTNYSNRLNSMYNNKDINAQDYLLMKNHQMVYQYLADPSISEVTDETVYEFMQKIKAIYIEDYIRSQESKQIKTDELVKSTIDELSSEKEALAIKVIEGQRNIQQIIQSIPTRIQEAIDGERERVFKNRIEDKRKIVKALVRIFFYLFVASTCIIPPIYLIICEIFDRNNNTNPLHIVLSTLWALVGIILTVIELVRKEEHIHKIVTKPILEKFEKRIRRKRK